MGSVVPRPDGSEFIQGDLATYLKIDVPMVEPPATRSNRLEGVNRRMAKEGSMSNTMAQAQLDAAGPLFARYETGRQLSDTGRSWLITVALPDGREAVVSRLRSSREGNGF